MPSVYFTPDHEEFRRQVRRFMEQEIAPHADQWEEAGAIPREAFASMGRLGFLGIGFPEEYGGSEADMLFAVIFLEELTRSRMGGFCAAVSVQQFMATQHIYRWGGEELKRNYLAPSIAGNKVGALAITEPDTGSDVAAIRSKAVRDGDHWVIDGAKTFITNGALGDFYTLAVKTDPAGGAAGVSLIVVDREAPGVRATRLKKLGWYCSDTAEVAFEGVRAPAGRLVGRENMGFYYLMEAFPLERLCGAAISVGSADICLQEALAYMRQRTAFGRSLTKYQALTHRLADLASQLEATRQLIYHAAWLMENGHPHERECTMAKLVATELNQRVADACLQCLGGYGFMEEYPMARFFRDARAGTIVAGTSEIMREILARLMTGEAPPDRGKSLAGEQGPDLAELFNSLPGRLRAEKVADWQGVFHFELAGGRPGQWTVEIGGGGCRVSQGHQGQAGCLVEMDAATYIGIETGALDPQAAFMGGKIKVNDLGAMLKYLTAFRPLDK